MRKLDKRKPFVSIIIPTKNEENDISKILMDIQQQDYPEKEIIVADAGSEDKTIEIARDHHAKVVKGGLPAYGRNQGALAAKGDYFIFFDADITIAPGFLTRAVQEFDEYCL